MRCLSPFCWKTHKMNLLGWRNECIRIVYAASIARSPLLSRWNVMNDVRVKSDKRLVYHSAFQQNWKYAIARSADGRSPVDAPIAFYGQLRMTLYFAGLLEGALASFAIIISSVFCSRTSNAISCCITAPRLPPRGESGAAPRETFMRMIHLVKLPRDIGGIN